MYEVHRLRRFREELVAVTKGVGADGPGGHGDELRPASFITNRGWRCRCSSAACCSHPGGAAGVVGGGAQLRARGVNQSHALIVGTGRLARRTVRTLHSIRWSGIKTIGYVEDEAQRGPAATWICRSWGTSPSCRNWSRSTHIHHVFIALPLNRYADARRVFDALSQTVVDVQLIADVAADGGHDLPHHPAPRHDGDRPAREPAPRAECRRETDDGRDPRVRRPRCARAS